MAKRSSRRLLRFFFLGCIKQKHGSAHRRVFTFLSLTGATAQWNSSDYHEPQKPWKTKVLATGRFCQNVSPIFSPESARTRHRFFKNRDASAMRPLMLPSAMVECLSKFGRPLKTTKEKKGREKQGGNFAINVWGQSRCYFQGGWNDPTRFTQAFSINFFHQTSSQVTWPILLGEEICMRRF